MSVEQNLIEVQSRLQNPASVTNQDLLKYANGSNPEVPSFLALIEMNRRKQISDSSDAFDKSNQASIKDQLTNSLTAPKQFTSPAAMPTGVNMGAAAPNQINVGASPFGGQMTQAPANQVNPTATPTMAASGGLMSLPVNHFNANSYAGGGIVAFQSGELVGEARALSSFPQAREADTSTMSDAAIASLLRNEAKKEEVQAPAATGASKGYQGILDSLPKVPVQEQKSLEELYADRKNAEKLAGVVADPYADSKKRMAALEERQSKNNEEAGLNRLFAQLSAFSKADPSKGLGYASAVGADASMALEEKQNALRDKQEAAQIEFANAMAKEEDARRHKDADGILAAQKDQQEAAFKFQKAEHDRGMLAAHIYQTDEYASARKQAAADAAENRPSAEDKKLLKVQTTVNANPVVRSIADAIKQGTIEIGSEEYYKALRKINEIAKPLYQQAGLPVPQDVIGDVNEAPIKKPGFFESIFGSSKPSAPAGKTVSFDQLPKN